MKVLITGGTGFLGSHVCRALMASGNDVRLLVRNREKAEAFYAGLGEGMPELVPGDVTDAHSVRRSLKDCDAVVHAAALTPIGSTSVREMFAVNVDGVRNVVDYALEAGLGRIICVSSITAIFNKDGSKVTPEARPTRAKLPYGRSKVEAEYFLRDLQRQGAKITTIYPGGIIGPDDPGFSDTCMALKYRIESGFRVFGKGGMQQVDVRDLAAFIQSLAEREGRGRYLLPGVYLTWTELADLIEEVSGCQLQRIPASGWKLRMVGRALDIARKFRKIDSPISAETMRYATQWPNIRNTGELQRRHLSLRDPADTLRDTLEWMVAAGHLDPALCPKLAPAEAVT